MTDGDPHAEPDEFAVLVAAKTRHVEQFLATPGVHGVGIGRKTVGGTPTVRLALVVFVDEKRPRDRLGAEESIPDQVIVRDQGREVVVLTDVVETGPLVPQPHLTAAQRTALRSKTRPAPGGVAVASPVGSGTLGGWAFDDVTDQQVFLSNSHVLGTTAGALVMQPFYPLPGDTTDYRFGRVVRASSNYDAAIGAPFDRAEILAEILGNGGAIFELATPTVDMAVEKTGWSTYHTLGHVIAVNITERRYCFDTTTAFAVRADDGGQMSRQGDSGSLIMESTHPDGQAWKRAVGLLYCGQDVGPITLGHPIVEVFDDLGLVTICEALGRVIADILERLSARSRPADRTFARDVARRLEAGELGRAVVKAVGVHRAAAVAVLLDGDGRRAVEAALEPILERVVTTDDLLDHVISDADVAAFERLFRVIDRVAPDAGEAVERGRWILEGAAGRTIGDVLLGELPGRSPGATPP